MSNSILLQEHTPVSKARRIDEDAGVLHDLVVLGPESQNNRDYPESTMREALPLLEGRQSFVNHIKPGGGEPSAYDVLGTWRECRVEGGKVRGNFHYFRSHPLAARLVEAARRPELQSALGFSISARGRTAQKNGRTVVESLEKVLSIDCVAQPATVKSLYESRGNTSVKTKITDLAEALAVTRPGYARALLEMGEPESGVMGPGAMMDEPSPPPEDPAGAGEGGDHEQAIEDAAVAVLRDKALSVPEKMKKIKKLLALCQGGAGVDGGGGEYEPDGDEDMGTEESRKKSEKANLQEGRLQKLEARERLREAADSQGVRLPKTLLESISPQITQEQAKQLVQELKGLPAYSTVRARSATPIAPVQSGGGGKHAGSQAVQESRKDVKPPEGADAAGMARWMQSGVK